MIMPASRTWIDCAKVYALAAIAYLNASTGPTNV